MTMEQQLATDAMTECLSELEKEEVINDLVRVSQTIGRCMMRMRAAIDNDGADYDLVEDEEGYQVSILLALMHWSAAEGRPFLADLQRARGMFEDDIAPEDGEAPTPATCANPEGVAIL